MNRLFKILLLITLPFICRGQRKVDSLARVDKYVATIKCSDADSLVTLLTKPCRTEFEKVYSIFRWITMNIGYDVKGYHDLNNLYEGLWPHGVYIKDSAEMIYSKRIAQKVLAEKVAVCDGYSRLFKRLCDIAGLKAEYIAGQVKTKENLTKSYSFGPHAWNAVMVDGKWYLLDATWASGTVNNAVTRFNRAYNSEYFLASPHWMIERHYPDDLKWALLPHPIRKSGFNNVNIDQSKYYENKIVSYRPIKTDLMVKLGQEMIFEIETEDTQKPMFISEFPSQGYTKEQRIADFAKTKTTGNRVTIPYVFKSDKITRLDVFYGGNMTLSYNIIFTK